jgi:hypothetical protein
VASGFDNEGFADLYVIERAFVTTALCKRVLVLRTGHYSKSIFYFVDVLTLQATHIM